MGFDCLGQKLRAEGSHEAEREVIDEYHSPTYTASFKSVLIVAVVMLVVFLIGALLLFA